MSLRYITTYIHKLITGKFSFIKLPAMEPSISIDARNPTSLFEDQVDNMRTRKVVTRSGKRFRGKFPSRKLGRMVHWESLLEQDAIYHFEYHPLVVSYQEQPSIEIYYDKEGEQHRYFPDFRLDFQDGRELYVEVKPAEILATKVVQEKLQAVAKRFEEQGRHFRVMTEQDIRREPLFANLKSIHQSTKLAAQAVPDAQLFGKLSGGPIWKLANIAGLVKGIKNVLRLVRSNHLHMDLEKPLTDDSDVWTSTARGGANGSFRI